MPLSRTIKSPLGAVWYGGSQGRVLYFVLFQGRFCDRFRFTKPNPTSVNKEDGAVELVGSFVGHADAVISVLQKDDNVLVTGSRDCTLKEWNLTTHKCINTIPSSRYCCLFLTRNRSTVMCAAPLLSLKMVHFWVVHTIALSSGGTRVEMCFGPSWDTKHLFVKSEKK